MKMERKGNHVRGKGLHQKRAHSGHLPRRPPSNLRGRGRVTTRSNPHTDNGHTFLFVIRLPVVRACLVPCNPQSSNTPNAHHRHHRNEHTRSPKTAVARKGNQQSHFKVGWGGRQAKELYQPTVGLAENREREPMFDPSRFLCTFVPGTLAGPPNLGAKSEVSRR